MKVLVCGGRDFGRDQTDIAHLDRTLNDIHAKTPITELIHGQARGADSMGAYWAAQKDIPRRAFPADWRAHGKAAGPIRNQQMLDEAKPDLVIAFPGGHGTADMVRKARAAGVPVHNA